MPGSVISVVSDPDEFQAALREDGVLNLLITGHGEFRARLTQVALRHLRLSAGDERISRIAFAAIPADAVFVSLPAGDEPAPIWDGVEMQVGEMITLGPGQRVHARTDGPCRWGGIRLSAEELARYAGALRGATFAVPRVARWRPPRAALRQLRQLLQAAIRTAKVQSGVLADVEAAHGLDQQLIYALIECLSDPPAQEETSAARRHPGILAGFEDLLQADPFARLAEICASLGVSDRLLRERCKEHLRMGPSQYLRLRRLQQVHRALRSENPDTASVSEVAARCGIRDLGRFASHYRALYGELPSASLRRRSTGNGTTPAAIRPRVKFP